MQEEDYPFSQLDESVQLDFTTSQENPFSVTEQWTNFLL